MIRCFVFLLLIPSLSHAQEYVKEFYDQDNARTVDSLSLYYRIGKKSAFNLGTEKRPYIVESYVDTVFSYYTDGNKLRSKEIYADRHLNGSYSEYYKNGTLKETGRYRDGDKTGIFTTWYPNGKEHKVVEYVGDEEYVFNGWPGIDFKIVDYWDSLGAQVITNGNGVCSCYFVKESEDYIREVGKVVNGFRDSVWSGSIRKVIVFREEYNQRQFINGVRFDEKQYTYDKLEVMADYPDGLSECDKFLRKNLNYPKTSRKKGIEGSVFIAFVVEADGSIVKVEVIKGVNSELDNEAMRVINMMPNWTPALIRGKVVMARYVLPIKFKLGY